MNDIFSNIRIALSILWNWYFLAAINLIISIVSLGTSIANSFSQPSIQCNINNIIAAVAEGQFTALSTMQQAASSLFSLEHNVPDLTSPRIAIFFGALWALRCIADGEDSGPNFLTNLLLGALVAIAIFVDFNTGIRNSQAQDRAGMNIFYQASVLQELKPDAIQVASESSSSSEDQPIQACKVALDMLSAIRLRYCTTGPEFHDCFVSSKSDPDRSAAIEAETQRWLFSEN
ncbi:hypothetical protein WJ542_03380 [Paraburkholderia sp. B3]|uniref:hypothetical protein n=1 Tax=Paraburkholderia sp. B3 TaxID=3134791 RepID=UPI003982D544